MPEVKIKLKVKDGVEVELTVEEAQQLAALLDATLGRGIQVWPVYPQYPVYPVYTVYPTWPTYTSDSVSVPSVLTAGN